jgi:hypothetical protein
MCYVHFIAEKRVSPFLTAKIFRRARFANGASRQSWPVGSAPHVAPTPIASAGWHGTQRQMQRCSHGFHGYMNSTTDTAPPIDHRIHL